MTDRELMQQALDALEFSNEYLEAISDKLFPKSKKANPGSTLWHVQKAITALRERLAQPELTPYTIHSHGAIQRIAPRKPLTDEELEAMAEKYVTNCYFDTLKYARAIEAAHGIKE